MPVPESDVDFIHDGGLVKVRIQATGRTLTGKIVRFTHSLDTTTRTMLTEVDVPNSDLSLSPGMYAESDIQLEQKAGVLTVPAQAVVQGGDQPYVLIVDAQKHIQRRDVTPGIQQGDKLEIVSGLQEGDQVVVAGQSHLQVGEAVRPRTNATTYQEEDGK
jgi:RND family efflux transporter MFP subunit